QRFERLFRFGLVVHHAEDLALSEAWSKHCGAKHHEYRAGSSDHWTPILILRDLVHHRIVACTTSASKKDSQIPFVSNSYHSFGKPPSKLEASIVGVRKALSMWTRQTVQGESSPSATFLMRLALAGPLLSAALPSPLHAHGFGQRYDLPVPLWLYLLGAGATVGLSFIMVAVFLRARRSRDRRFRVALPSVGMVGRSMVLAIRIAAIAVFAVVVIAG